ncbi:hypothetical protein RCL_jg8746.t1 [Rhizophagus clarus]|uniref:Uncharacterized protein n=1 Tax=Rhizophagus clarus TaxID=94130 RepID=A0A8H3LYZ1_9GLOM|nr:hypothetical protein RCL_jg8746.t1 [Rhizophagus clarus]
MLSRSSILDILFHLNANLDWLHSGINFGICSIKILFRNSNGIPVFRISWLISDDNRASTCCPTRISTPVDAVDIFAKKDLIIALSKNEHSII